MKREWAKALSQAAQIGTRMIACIVIGVFLGRFLDQMFQTEPWLTLIFSISGVGAAIRSILELIPKE